jgi:hypothetical protein
MRITLNIVGAVLVLCGVIWFLQGINVLPGSFMTEGQIVGFFTDANQNTIGFVGNPTPEPRAFALAALAVVAIGLFWRSKFKAHS